MHIAEVGSGLKNQLYTLIFLMSFPEQKNHLHTTVVSRFLSAFVLQAIVFAARQPRIPVKKESIEFRTTLHPRYQVQKISILFSSTVSTRQLYSFARSNFCYYAANFICWLDLQMIPPGLWQAQAKHGGCCKRRT